MYANDTTLYASLEDFPKLSIENEINSELELVTGLKYTNFFEYR